MEKLADGGRGRIVLATVRGDVHDIGKNLVDIILSNNGYEVVNIGIKQPVSAIIAAAEEHNADVIGMSGLLVKSTVVMRDNLAELNARGLAKRWPVLLGGAALTRAYVEQDLAAPVRGRGPLRPRRLRGAAPDGGGHGGQARRPRRRPARAARAPRRRPARPPRRRPDPAARPPPPSPARRTRRSGRRPSRSTTASPSRRSGGPRWSRACSSPSTGRTWTSGPRSWASGASSRRGRRAAPPTRSSSRPRGGRGCGCGWSGRRPKGCCRPPSSTGTSAASARATT